MAEPFRIEYEAPPTLASFMMTPGYAGVRAVRGPVGSGKSTAMVMELFRRAIEQEPGRDGLRRTRFAVVRNTLPQLRTTCLETVKTVLGPLAKWQPSKSEVSIKFDDVESTWLFLPLDTPQNVQRLLSLELTGAWISEFREISPQLVKDVYSRCSRYPSSMEGGPTWWGMIMETNSFTEDSGWYPLLELDLPSNWDYFVQPPGVTLDEDGEYYEVTGENTENLDEDYYSGQIESNGGLDSEWVKQYILNEIGPSLSGEAVFYNTFIEDFHVAEGELSSSALNTICIGLDTGRNPAAIITQEDSRGRLLVLGECYGENMGIEKFVTEYLSPLLSQPRYVRSMIYCVIDPAGRAKSEIGEESVLKALGRMGFSAALASTNKIDPRLRSVEKRLQHQIDGKGAILFDPVHCPSLIAAMKSKYRFKKKKSGELEPIPDKTHPWSDLADALQYACLGGTEKVRAKVMRKLQRNDFGNGEQFTPVSSAGWT